MDRTLGWHTCHSLEMNLGPRSGNHYYSRLSSSTIRQNSISRKSVSKVERPFANSREIIASCAYQHHRTASGQSHERKSFPECLRSGPSPPPGIPHARRPSAQACGQHGTYANRPSAIPMEPSRGQNQPKSHVGAPHSKSGGEPRFLQPDHESDQASEYAARQQSIKPHPSEELLILERLDRKIDDVLSYVRDTNDRVKQVQSSLRSLAPSPSQLEKQVLAAFTNLEDRLDPQVWVNQIINSFVPALDRWAARTIRPAAPARVLNASPTLPFAAAYSPGGKRVSMVGNRSQCLGRTPGTYSVLADSLTLSENGTDWGNGSQLFCTPHTTLFQYDKRLLNGSQESWEKIVDNTNPGNNVLPVASPATLDPISEILSPAGPHELSRESTAHTTPIIEHSLHEKEKNEGHTPKPSTRGTVST